MATACLIPADNDGKETLSQLPPTKEFKYGCIKLKQHLIITSNLCQNNHLSGTSSFAINWQAQCCLKLYNIREKIFIKINKEISCLLKHLTAKVKRLKCCCPLTFIMSYDFLVTKQEKKSKSSAAP